MNKKVLVQCDQSGAEALVVAYLCKHGRFRELFLNGIKPHVYTAMHVFAEQLSKMPDVFDNKTLIQALIAEPKDLKNIEGWAKLAKAIAATDEWEASKRYYFIGKMITHASNYDMRARTFRLNVLQKSDGEVALTHNQCEQMLMNYHNLFPEIHRWHQDTIAEVKRTKLIRNLFGHPRVFTGRLDESEYKEVYAFVPQSTVGQITNYAFTECQEEIESGLHPADIDLLQNNHDSILAQCYRETVDYTARLISTKLNRKLVSPRGEEFQMRSECNWSPRSWGEMVNMNVFDRYKRWYKIKQYETIQTTKDEDIPISVLVGDKA